MIAKLGMHQFLATAGFSNGFFAKQIAATASLVGQRLKPVLPLFSLSAKQ
jgi:hypothetical protein